MKIFINLAVFCFLFYLVSPAGNAQSVIYIGGTFSGTSNWTADTVKVTDNLTLDTLIIGSGTVIELQGNYRITVDKYLEANGAVGDTILFTVKDTTGLHDLQSDAGGWGGIYTPYGSNGKVYLNYCKVEYAKSIYSFEGAVFGGFNILQISNSHIVSNNCQGVSGDPLSRIVIIRSNIADNKGDGISHTDGSLTIDSSRIANNFKAGIVSIESDLSIQNSVIEYNGFEGLFGYLWNLNISGNIFQYNKKDGINIYRATRVIAFKNNLIRFNQGTGLKYREGTGSIMNNLISNNKKYGVYIELCGPSLINNTIVYNTGGGIKLHATAFDVSLYNCIIRYNDGLEQIYADPGQNINLYHCNTNGFTSDDTHGEFVNNIDADPYFIDPVKSDFHLSDYSVCINAGIEDTTGLYLSSADLEGNPRIFDQRIDIGTYEYQYDNFHILKQPSDMTVCEGSVALFETEAIGGVTGYQWQKNGVDMPSENLRMLVFDTVRFQDSGYYNCLIFADDRMVSTDTVKFTTDHDFKILEQSNSFTYCPVKDTSLLVKASGNNLNFQWYRNDDILSGATNSLLFIGPPETAQPAIYYCMVSNKCKSVKSREIDVHTLEIPDAPLVSSLEICTEDTIPGLYAEGENIKWYLDEELSNLIALGNRYQVSLTEPGVYHYYVTRSELHCESRPSIATITLKSSPEIPLAASYSACENTDLVLNAGEGFNSYNWSTGAVTGNINATTTGTYSVTVTGSNGCSARRSVNVTIFDLPVVILPNDTVINLNDTLILDAGSGFNSYEWNTGSVDPLLTVYANEPGMYYYAVEVTDQHQCSSSEGVVVTVDLLNAAGENYENQIFSIYPVPAVDELNVMILKDIQNEVAIRIVDNAGHLVRQMKVTNLLRDNTYRIDVSNLQSGIYYVQIMNDRNFRTQKVTIIK